MAFGVIMPVASFFEQQKPNPHGVSARVIVVKTVVRSAISVLVLFLGFARSFGRSTSVDSTLEGVPSVNIASPDDTLEDASPMAIENIVSSLISLNFLEEVEECFT
ncbi:MAG TPA: hypothetical protein VJV05_03555 [Pyrinomonadaceae bacterium]|nr:hypothetical protein [Pyrinomonadaceae bacterium]